MTITWTMLAAFAAGYAVRELIGFIYREGRDRGAREVVAQMLQQDKTQ